MFKTKQAAWGHIIQKLIYVYDVGELFYELAVCCVYKEPFFAFYIYCNPGVRRRAKLLVFELGKAEDHLHLYSVGFSAAHRQAEARAQYIGQHIRGHDAAVLVVRVFFSEVLKEDLPQAVTFFYNALF